MTNTRMECDEMNICIFGSARDDIGSRFLDAGYRLGELIAKQGDHLVFGAGSTGMMGAVSRGVLDNNGELTGITPTFMKRYEQIQKCTKVIYTDKMSTRKVNLCKISDGFIVTAGGIGTYDEFFEILTLKQLDVIDKPIVILNTDGYFNKLIDLLQHTFTGNFMDFDVLKMYSVAKTPEEAMEQIHNYVK